MNSMHFFRGVFLSWFRCAGLWRDPFTFDLFAEFVYRFIHWLSIGLRLFSRSCHWLIDWLIKGNVSLEIAYCKLIDSWIDRYIENNNKYRTCIVLVNLKSFKMYKLARLPDYESRPWHMYNSTPRNDRKRSKTGKLKISVILCRHKNCAITVGIPWKVKVLISQHGRHCASKRRHTRGLQFQKRRPAKQKPSRFQATPYSSAYKQPCTWPIGCHILHGHCTMNRTVEWKSPPCA